MKLATILPQPYLHLAQEDDYHMCLANLINAEGMEDYTFFFQHRNTSSYCIMDNGVIEGNPRPIPELIRKAELIGANEIVMPDAFKDIVKTLMMLDDAYNYLYSSKSTLRTMAVPQGVDLDEWIVCAKRILRDFPVTCIGVPKVLTSIAGRDGRLKAVKLLQEECGAFLQGKEIHLLGCWQSPLELTMFAKADAQGSIPPIRGCDSVIAYNFARAGLRLNDADRPDGDPIDFKMGTLDDEKESILKYNIQLWKDSVDMNQNKKVIHI